MNLIIVGSIALDDVKTPYGEREKGLGGSGVYASVSASYFAKAGIVGVVGEDFPEEHIEFLKKHQVDLEGMEKTEGKTFYWKGYYENDMAVAHTQDTQLNVFASFAPKIPESYKNAPFVFLANIHPALQLEVLKSMTKPEFVMLDSMNLWIDNELDTLMEVISKVDMVVVNDGEARQLAGTPNLLRAAKWIQEKGPRGVMIKKGEHGALVFWENYFAVIPAYPLLELKDPTGAGDTYAGGFIGALAQMGKITPESIRQAASVGTVMASYVVQGFSADRTDALIASDIRSRHDALRELTTIDKLDLKMMEK